LRKFAPTVAVALAAGLMIFKVSAQEPKFETLTAADTAQAMSDFNTTCAGCHGEDAGGGDRAPALVDNPHLRVLDVAGIEAIIRSGQRAMPPFPNLPQAQLTRLASWLHSQNLSGLRAAPPEQVAAGEAYFYGAGGCSGCHMSALDMDERWIELADQRRRQRARHVRIGRARTAARQQADRQRQVGDGHASQRWYGRTLTQGVGVGTKRCRRTLSASTTTMLPLSSTMSPSGRRNWPGCPPRVPSSPCGMPVGESTWMRWL